MKLTVLKANELSSPLKVTIQKTGKLGFTAFTASRLEIDTETYVMFYMDEDQPQSPILTFSKKCSSEAFRAHLGGSYYSLSTTALFDHLGIDYKQDNIICDLKREEEADAIVGGKAYRLVAREQKRRKKATAIQLDINT